MQYTNLNQSLQLTDYTVVPNDQFYECYDLFNFLDKFPDDF